MDVPPDAEGLFALPPSRFTTERDALARALAARGDPAAEAVRRLRRPVGLAWLLNRLARERPEEVQALAEAGDRLRAGQGRALAGGGAEELRRAERDLRERARALRSEGERILAAAGRREDPAAHARLELLLRAAALARGPLGDAFRRGLLQREPDVAGDLSGLTVLQGGRAGAHHGGRTSGARGGGAERRSEERAARRARERELARLRKALGAAEDRAARAERRAAEAEERAARERARAGKEREEAERARRRLEEAERPR